jgi:hypothetical protein
LFHGDNEWKKDVTWGETMLKEEDATWGETTLCRGRAAVLENSVAWRGKTECHRFRISLTLELPLSICRGERADRFEVLTSPLIAISTYHPLSVLTLVFFYGVCIHRFSLLLAELS